MEEIVQTPSPPVGSSHVPALNVPGDGLQGRDEVSASGCQPVTDGNGDGGCDGTFHEFGCFQLLEAHGEHARRHPGNKRCDLGEAVRAAREGDEDARGPALSDYLQDLAGVPALGFVSVVPGRRGGSGGGSRNSHLPIVSQLLGVCGGRSWS